MHIVHARLAVSGEPRAFLIFQYLYMKQELELYICVYVYISKQWVTTISSTAPPTLSNDTGEGETQRHVDKGHWTA